LECHSLLLSYQVTKLTPKKKKNPLRKRRPSFIRAQDRQSSPMSKTFIPILILKWKRSSHLHLHVDSPLCNNINHDPYIPQGKSFMMQSVEEIVLLLMRHWPSTSPLIHTKLAAAKHTHHGPKQNTKNGEEGREWREPQEEKRERGRLKSAGALVPHFARSEARPVAATNILQLRNGVLRTRKPHRVCGNVTVVAGMAMRNRLGNQKRAKLVTVSPPLLYKMFTVFYFSPFFFTDLDFCEFFFHFL
jgi:hypothetical protein